MFKFNEEKGQLKCSFCGKSQDQVRKLVAGPGVYICDECSDLCNESVERSWAKRTSTQQPAQTPGNRISDHTSSGRPCQEGAVRGRLQPLQRSTVPPNG